jgi:CheY-like chemotaxis protein
LLTRHGQSGQFPCCHRCLNETSDNISEMLAQLGIVQIMLATDGAQALTILKNETPDLLLCDLSMPEMDGIEFLRFVATQTYAN